MPGIFLKYNGEDTVKLLKNLDSNYKKEMRHIQNCIKRPRWRFCENV